MGRSTSGGQQRWSKQQLDPPYLDVTTSRESIYDPPQTFSQLRDQADPAPVKFHAGHNGWVVTGYALAKQVLADRRLSARPELAHGNGAATLRGFHGPGLFHLSDPPEHTRLRGTVTSEFTPTRIQAWEPTVRRIADECIDKFVGENPDNTADLVAGFAVPFPALVMAEVLGLPSGTRDLFLHAARRAVTGSSNENLSLALSTFTGFLKENPAGARDLLLYAARRVVTRTNSAEDRAGSLTLIAGFLKETMSDLDEADGFLGRLAARCDTDADEAAGIAAQVLVAGTMVPASMLGLALHLLLSRADGLAPFASSPEAATLATEEVLRFLSFESQPRIRVATEDVEIGGARIRAGQLVAVALDTANRDPGVFPEPDVLKLDRDGSKNLAFGWGGHQCLGQNLARLEIRVALAQIALRLPGLRLDDNHRVVVRDDIIVHSVSSLPAIWAGGS